MTVTEKAYAKINLFLDVLGRRDDGFHDILSVMHSVDLCDTLTLSLEYSDHTNITINTNRSELPVDESNIVYRAVIKYISYFDIHAEINVSLEKLIPIGAGLGGGSSDAAATLRALNKICGKADLDQLLEFAAELGSDVPFCLLGGLAVCGGRGERFTSLSKMEEMNFVIAIGEQRISTPQAYSSLDKLYNNFESGATSESLGYNQRIANMLEKSDFDVPIYNIFEQVTHSVEIEKIKEVMAKNRAEYTLMSGSGPSVFGRFKDKSDAETACNELLNNGFTAFVCRSVYPEVNI